MCVQKQQLCVRFLHKKRHQNALSHRAWITHPPPFYPPSPHTSPNSSHKYPNSPSKHHFPFKNIKNDTVEEQKITREAERERLRKHRNVLLQHTSDENAMLIAAQRKRLEEKQMNLQIAQEEAQLAGKQLKTAASMRAKELFLCRNGGKKKGAEEAEKECEELLHRHASAAAQGVEEEDAFRRSSEGCRHAANV